MELPDPISKVTWDNYVTMSPIDVKEMGLHEMLRQDIDGSIVDLTVNGINCSRFLFTRNRDRLQEQLVSFRIWQKCRKL